MAREGSGMIATWRILATSTAIFYSAPPIFAEPVAPRPIHQTPIDAFHHWSGKELASIIQKPNVSVDLSDHEFFFVDTIMRDRSGMVEVHDRWNDYLVIQKGDGLVAYGGKAGELKQVSPGEWRAATMEGGKAVPVHPGDLVVIPAGTAHQMRLAVGKTIRYLAFKSRQ
jgi:mannose-6-phosphate isomerase-like protein (cupin superfamily)